VLDPNGRLECSIAAVDLPRSLSGRQLVDLARHVLDAADRLTSAVTSARATRP
jgi:hypothetical protein